MKCKYDRENCKFLGDIEECAMCFDGIMGVSNYLPKEVTRNLEQPDEYSLLGEVIDDWISDLEAEDIYMLPKLIEKMKDFRVKHFNEHIEY